MLLFALTWEFWIVVIAFGLLVVASASDKENHIFAIGTLLAMFLALRYVGDFSIFDWVKEHPYCLWFLPLYFVIGSFWSVGKWYLFLRDKFNETKHSWEETSERKNSVNLSGFVLSFPSFSAYAKERKPEARKHKERIIYWINFWPVSLFWTISRELFEKIATRIFHAIRGIYDRLSNRMFDLDEGGK